MLEKLLDPRGQLGQRDLFLRAILKIIWERLGREDCLPDQTHISAWSVRRERVFNVGRKRGGQMDIVVENKKESIVIVIENKIDATDQLLQVDRYHKWLDCRRRDGFLKPFLVYLTPDGRRPSEKAVNKSSHYEHLVLMSHNYDIADIVRNIASEIKSVESCSLIMQYGDLARGV